MFLDSIHYDIGAYWHIGLWNDHIEFHEHEKEFELLAEQIYLFVDSRPNFFTEFDGRFSIREDGLLFIKRNVIHLDYSHPVAAEGWADAANNYHDAFPENVFSGEVDERIYPNYISFYSALIYTRDGKYPQEYVAPLKEEPHRGALVIRHAKGWYEVMTYHK